MKDEEKLLHEAVRRAEEFIKFGQRALETGTQNQYGLNGTRDHGLAKHQSHLLSDALAQFRKGIYVD